MQKDYEKNYLNYLKSLLNEAFVFIESNHYMPKEMQGMIIGFMKAGRAIGITFQTLEETIYEITKGVFGKKMGFNEVIKEYEGASYNRCNQKENISLDKNKSQMNSIEYLDIPTFQRLYFERLKDKN